MPVFDRNKIIVNCDFTDNIVVAGGSIRGTVHIYVLEPVTLCGASLRYHIDESFITSHEEHGKTRPTLNKTSFNIEYILFGHRSTKKSTGGVVAVPKGHYKYPFVIPVPSNAPPSSNFGSLSEKDSGGRIVRGQRVTILVDHRVDVNIYVARSLMDKQATYSVPMVVKCTSPYLLLAPNNGAEGFLKHGMSTTFSGKRGNGEGLLKTLFSKPTKEQADCSLYVYNVTVSHADTPFLHYVIRGTINCPYYISLVRVTSYGMGSPFATNNPNAARGGGVHVTEEVVSRVMMPPLDTTIKRKKKSSSDDTEDEQQQEMGVKGRLVLSPHALQSSTSFQGRFVQCQFFVTIDLIYKSGGIDAGFHPKDAIRIPIDVNHGSHQVEEGHAVYNNNNSSSNNPHNHVSDTILDGAVMAYTVPVGIPLNQQRTTQLKKKNSGDAEESSVFFDDDDALYVPIVAPVTEGDGAIAPAAWGGSELRYNRGAASTSVVNPSRGGGGGNDGRNMNNIVSHRNGGEVDGGEMPSAAAASAHGSSSSSAANAFASPHFVTNTNGDGYYQPQQQYYQHQPQQQPPSVFGAATGVSSIASTAIASSAPRGVGAVGAFAPAPLQYPSPASVIAENNGMVSGPGPVFDESGRPIRCSEAEMSY